MMKKIRWGCKVGVTNIIGGPFVFASQKESNCEDKNRENKIK